MAIKRFSRTELEEVGKELFYDYLSSEGNLYVSDSKKIIEYESSNELPTPMDLLHKEHLDTIAENEQRIRMYERHIEANKGRNACLEALNVNLSYLKKEREIFLTTNLKNQKKLLKKEGSIEYTTNKVLVPLNKKLNSLYDDFYLSVAFHDDIGVLNGQYSTYKSLETTEERKNFIIANTEITHMCLFYYSRGILIAIIGIVGNLNTKTSKFTNMGISILDKSYCDFNKTTLSDTLKIANNDVRQLIQSRIDLDKESMHKVCEKYIGNDLYGIYLNTIPKSNHEMYIRYTCPSTGRVYYNELVFSNLQISEYYTKDEPISYIDAWWNINNLGANPYNKKAMIRC